MKQVNGDSGVSQSTANLVGFYSAILTAVFTVITFGFAVTAIPISGANCPGECISYPYLDTVAQFPRDYRWMVPAIILMLAYVILIVSIHSFAVAERKIFSQIGVAFAIISAGVLLIDYYVQVSVIPVSLMNSETEGIALLTQYNPHGIFIALEELGYLLMSLSFLAVAPVFSTRNRLENAIRWIFIIGVGLAIVSLAAILAIYGLERQDRFEVVVISINFLVLIINGTLLSVVFNKQLKANREL